MTSNVGARLITEEKASFGFVANSDNSSSEKIKESVLGELKNTFRPEFLNRVDDIIVFNRLTEDEIRQIAKNLLITLEKRMQALEINMTFDDSVVDFVSKAGFDKIYGARPLKRAIQKQLEDTLSEAILKGDIKKGDTVLTSLEGNKIIFKCKVL